jgi:hypothetical protein
LALPWWFTHQGNEFYLASKLGLSVSKISFHRDGNWQMRTGNQVIRFAPTRIVSGNWLHAASVRWYLSAGAFRPPGKAANKVRLLEVPENADLVAAIFVSVDDSNPPIPMVSGGNILVRDHLRDGRSVVIESFAVEADQQFASRVRNITAISLSGSEVPGDFYAETHEIYSDPEQGNILAVVPLGVDSLRLPARE